MLLIHNHGYRPHTHFPSALLLFGGTRPARYLISVFCFLLGIFSLSSTPSIHASFLGNLYVSVTNLYSEYYYFHHHSIHSAREKRKDRHILHFETLSELPSTANISYALSGRTFSVSLFQLSVK